MIAGISYYHIFQYFLIYSFLGWCTEVAYAAVCEGRVINRGFLNGPVCPIYGFGILAVFGTINTGLSRFGTGSSYTNLLLIFLCGMALTTMIELFGGWALDRLFHASWWDYSDKPFNFHGYICLQFSLLWGIGIVLVVEVLHPLIAATFDRILPETVGWPLMYFLYIVYASDTMLSVMIMVGLNKRLAELDEMQKRMRVVSNTLSDGIGRSALGTAQYIGEAKVQAALAKAEAMDSLSAAKAEAVDSLSAVKAEAVDSLSAVATGAVDSLCAVKAGAVDGLSAVKAGAVDGLSAVKEGAVDSLSAVKNGALDSISAVQSSGEKRLESLKKQYSRKTAALSRMVRGTRYFGAGRLLRAFPQMRHRKYRELLDKLKKDAEEGETIE
ncbi:MAG: hypothetical protein IJ126_05250 [Lachnospiraceae bacterium]|nr:hypothetical protein [Lachnospiraceae bacterium]